MSGNQDRRGVQPGVAGDAALTEDAALKAERTQLVFKGLLPILILSGICLIGITALLAHLYHDIVLWWLSVVAALGCLARIVVSQAFERRAKRGMQPGSVDRYEQLYAYTTVAYYCTLAVVTAYNFRVHDATSWVLCTLGVFMFCGGLNARCEMRPFLVHICVSILLASLFYGIFCLMHTYAFVAALALNVYAYANYKAVEEKHKLLLEQMLSRRKLRELAERDMLTGLANRRLFEESLYTICMANQPFAVFFIDLDKFKQVNDVHGHAVGDSLLKAVADRLRLAVRENDLIARLGGDEFAILLTGVTQTMPVEDLARRVNQALVAPFTLHNITVGIGCSIGVQLSSGHDPDPQRLLHAADQALYRVKESGGGSFALA